jgi:hypothetical protein
MKKILALAVLLASLAAAAFADGSGMKPPPSPTLADGSGMKPPPVTDFMHAGLRA